MAPNHGVGIVGSGFMGRTWAHVAHDHPMASLSAISGGSRAAALAQDYGVIEEQSFEGLLARDDVSIVIIASPPNAHLRQAVMAAEAGKHILVEKPMAAGPTEAQVMVDAAIRAEVCLSVVSQHRFRASPLAAKALLDDGAIGDVRMIRATGVTQWWDMSKTQDAWKRDPGEVNPYVDWGSHACDLVKWFAGSEPAVAYAQASSFSGTMPPNQSVMATYRFANDVLASVWMTYEVPPPGYGSPLNMLITGSTGLIEMDSYGATRLARDGEWRVVHEQLPFDAADPISEERLRAYRAQLTDVITAVTEGSNPLVFGKDAVLTQKMLFATLESAQSGLPILIPSATTSG